MVARARHFGILDAAILVAAVAAGCYLARTYYQEIVPLVTPRSVRRLPFVFRIIHDGCAALVAVLSAAMIVLHLRKPRPPIRGALEQPGLVGCIASTLVFGLCILTKLPNRSLSSVLLVASIGSAYAITAAWFLMLFADFWNPGPGWIDRIARFLCISWLILPFVVCLGLAA
jgi:hypothetical protein